jgi:hypothetical protein
MRTTIIETRIAMAVRRAPAIAERQKGKTTGVAVKEPKPSLSLKVKETESLVAEAGQ